MSFGRHLYCYIENYIQHCNIFRAISITINLVFFSDVFGPTYSKVERSPGAGRVCEVAQSGTCVRLSNHGTVNAALGVVEQRSYTRHTGGSLEEESHGE